MHVSFSLCIGKKHHTCVYFEFNEHVGSEPLITLAANSGKNTCGSVHMRVNPRNSGTMLAENSIKLAVHSWLIPSAGSEQRSMTTGSEPWLVHRHV